MEGDSLILITAAKKIQAGATAVKVATSWRLLSRLESLEAKLQNPHSITFQHVRRTANQVADRMANQGVSQTSQYFSGSLDIVEDEQLKKDCIALVQKDLSPPGCGWLLVIQGLWLVSRASVRPNKPCIPGGLALNVTARSI